MIRQLQKYQIYSATCKISVLLILIILSVGIYDFSRGIKKQYIAIPVCKSDCKTMDSNATRSLINRYDYGSSLTLPSAKKPSWLEFDATNLCELPPLYLEKHKAGSTLLMVNEAFSVFGIAEISQNGSQWLIKAGAGVDSYFDIARKIIDFRFARKSFYQPYVGSYGLWIFILVLIAYCSFLLSRTSRTKCLKKNAS